MKIYLEDLIVLHDLFKSVPQWTPRRLEVIFEFANDIQCRTDENYKAVTKTEIIIDINDEGYFSKESRFSWCMSNLARI